MTILNYTAEDKKRTWARLIAAAVIPAIVGTVFVYFVSSVFTNYGWTLFLGTPVVMGFVSTVIFDSKGERGFGICFLVSLLSIGVIGLLIMFVAIEGLICLIMALPFAAPLNATGALIAYVVTRVAVSPMWEK